MRFSEIGIYVTFPNPSLERRGMVGRRMCFCTVYLVSQRIMSNKLLKSLKTFGRVKPNELMSKHTTFKIGGPAKFFVIVEDAEQLVPLLQYLDGVGEQYMILGGGSNMLVADEGYDGVVIQVRGGRYVIDGEMVEATAGMNTVALAQATMQAKLTGFEWGVGVPGTIGGATRGNAGAMGFEMSGNVHEVEAYRNGELVTYSNEKCQFGYRDSVFKHSGSIVLKTRLKLRTTDSQELMQKAIGYLQYRNKTQPQGYSSTGCIFKNIDVTLETGQANRDILLNHFSDKDETIVSFLEKGKVSAGWLVEQVGMKGERRGNAEVSERHGNFIVNLGNAMAADVLALIEEITAKVYDTYGLSLEEEIKIVS